MSEWDFNISRAPRGRIVQEKIKHKNGKTMVVKRFVPDLVILCADDEAKTVTVSQWLPKEKRWSMFATGQAPLAWMAFPKHVNEGK